MAGPERAFEFQVELCRHLGSDLAARLLERALGDLRAGGTVARLVGHWDTREAVLGAVPLRLLAAAHRLALCGQAPEFARHLPTLGGTPVYPEVGDAFIDALTHGDLGDQLERFPQTNEVGRAGALLGAFLTVAARTHHRLELFEIGASAGLNLNWHRFRFELGHWSWGDSGSPAVVAIDWAGGRPPGPEADALEIVAVEGCDLSPVEVARDDEALRLCSYIWADQPQRLERLRGAIELARRHPTLPDLARAEAWLAPRLAVPATMGTTRIVYHSAVWFYLPEPEQERVRELIEEAGARATPDAPLAWVRLEHEDADLTLRVSTFPGERDECLAKASPHGLWVHWVGPSSGGLC